MPRDGGGLHHAHREVLELAVARLQETAGRSEGTVSGPEIEHRLARVLLIRLGAGGLVDKAWCIEHLADVVTSLPPEVFGDDLDRPELELARDGPVSLHYVPFERVNPAARVVVVGLTPGRQQMRLALQAAGASLRAGGSLDEALDAVSATASFAGPMRTRLVRMLDDIGLPEVIGVETTAMLWTSEGMAYEDSTSAILHAAFVGDTNWGGSSPEISKVPLLQAMARQVLGAHLNELSPHSLVVPLGKAAAEAVALAGVDGRRVLRGLPHPSGQNGHLPRQFAERRNDLARRVAEWAGR